MPGKQLFQVKKNLTV